MTEKYPGDTEEPVTSAELKEALISLSNRQKELVEVLKNKKEDKKDFWDKFSASSTFLSGVIVALVGLYFTSSFNSQQATRDQILKNQQIRLAQVELVQKFVPQLIGTDKERKLAIIAISSLDNPKLATQLAVLDPSEGSTAALKALATSGTDEERNRAQRALKRVNSAPVLFEGAVDGSAAADVGDGFFVGATDEDNELRLYDVKGGPSPKKLDVGVEAAVKSALGVEKIKECDLEGAAKIGDLIFWIGSHGRNSEGKEKKERQVLFATKLSGSGKEAKLEIAGKVYAKLLDDLVNDPALAPFDLAKAATLAPKDEGALNIESLAADGDKLWIGFRNPINKAKEALLVPLLNPTEAIREGARAKLGDPAALKLGGLGVRDMVAWNDGFLIIAGDFVDRFEPGAKPSRLFSWKPGTDPKEIDVDFGDLNPEAIVIMGQGDKARILILSDDGKYPGRSIKTSFAAYGSKRTHRLAVGMEIERHGWAHCPARRAKQTFVPWSEKMRE